ncbi:hypothetical protein [Xylanimonas protaetiae]|uniref:Uncharacterized protein n=1 Tax=Xylanimonas protaetiae TaxID=2509457 RepID=A0A4P6F956_9MICO|nr:hypothetical protein [Xylanimonas protaetiae]QAY71443.1 hypothetical protein ET471_16560 [Xylanimonas protaetiae]
MSSGSVFVVLAVVGVAVFVGLRLLLRVEGSLRAGTEVVSPLAPADVAAAVERAVPRLLRRLTRTSGSSAALRPVGERSELALEVSWRSAPDGGSIVSVQLAGGAEHPRNVLRYRAMAAKVLAAVAPPDAGGAETAGAETAGAEARAPQPIPHPAPVPVPGAVEDVNVREAIDEILAVVQPIYEKDDSEELKAHVPHLVDRCVALVRADPGLVELVRELRDMAVRGALSDWAANGKPLTDQGWHHLQVALDTAFPEVDLTPAER